MTFGFLTFGGNSMGVILNNFSTFDTGATVCRLLTAISVIGGYPFLISACRGELLELYTLITDRKPTRKDEKLTNAMLLSSLSLISMAVSDAGLIIGLAGAVMGSALVYVFPSLLYLSTTNKMKKPKTRTMLLERIFCRFLVVFGAFAAFAGVLTIVTGA
jgi:sodium-coupled neutral amino acid transporter 11